MRGDADKRGRGGRRAESGSYRGALRARTNRPGAKPRRRMNRGLACVRAWRGRGADRLEEVLAAELLLGQPGLSQGVRRDVVVRHLVQARHVRGVPPVPQVRQRRPHPQDPPRRPHRLLPALGVRPAAPRRRPVPRPTSDPVASPPPRRAARLGRSAGHRGDGRRPGRGDGARGSAREERARRPGSGASAAGGPGRFDWAGAAAATEAACESAWAENRRRFFTYGTPPASVATPTATPARK